MNRILLSFWLLFAASFAFADRPDNELWSFGRYFEDPTGQLDAAEILARAEEFQALNGPARFGQTLSHYWILFDLAPLAATPELWVELNNPAIDRIDFYQIHAHTNTLQLLYETGDALPFEQRPINYRSFAFPVNVIEGNQILLRVWGQTPLMLPIYATEPQEFVSHLNRNMGLISALLGLIFAMVCYNLFLYAGTRISDYGWYVIYVGNVWLFTMFANGLAYQYLWPGSPLLQNTLSYLFVSLFQWAAYNFARSFLATKTNLPRFDKVFRVLSFLPLFIFPSIFISGKITYLLITANTLLLFFIIPVISIWVWFKGLKVAGIYLLSWMFVITGMLTYNLVITGAIPLSFYTQHALEIGVAIESILLSFALALRIRQQEKKAKANLREAKLAIQNAFHETQDALALAKQSIAAKDNFLTSISHELKTPIHSVFGNLQLLAFEKLEAHQQQLVSSADASAIRLFYHIDNLLTYSEITAGDIRPDVQVVKLREEIEQNGTVWQQIASDFDVTLNVTVDPQVPEQLKVDWHHARTIGRIALDNAIKYTPDGTTVDLNVDWKQQGGFTFLQFTLLDEGPGVSEALNNWLNDGDAENHWSESGLGLFLCKQLIKVIKGQVTITNREDGKGTKFQFTFPVETVEQTNDTSTVDLNGKRILVVDDVAINLKVLQGMLKKLGMEVETASSGIEAIEKVKEEDFDLILMDCQMPEMTGQQATLQIRLLEATHKASIPVVAISANASDLDRQSCRQAGMNDFIAKPARMHSLKAVLELQFKEARLTSA